MEKGKMAKRVVAGVAGTVGKDVVEQAGKEAIKDVGKGAVTTLRQEVGKGMSDIAKQETKQLAKQLWQGFSADTLKNLLKIPNVVGTIVSKNASTKNLFRFLFRATDEQLTQKLGKFRPRVEKIVQQELEKMIAKMDQTSGAIIRAEISKNGPIATLRKLSTEDGLKSIIGADEATAKALNQELIKETVSNVVKGTEGLMKSSPEFAKIIGTGSLVGFSARAYVWLNIYELISGFWDRYRQSNRNLIQKVNVLISELESIISPSLLPPEIARKQDPQFLINMKRAIVELKNIAPSLNAIESEYVSSSSNISHEKVNTAQINKELEMELIEVGTKSNNNHKKLITVITNTENIINKAEIILNDYTKSVFELISGITLPFVSNVKNSAQKAISHIEDIKNDLQLYKAALNEGTAQIDIEENKLTENTKVADITNINNITKLALYNYMQTAMLLKKKVKFAQTYEQISSRKINEQKPGFIAKHLGPLLIKVIPESWLFNPAKMNAAFSVLDGLFLKSQVKLSSSIGTKIIGPIMSKVIGATAGKAVGTFVGGGASVVMVGLTAIDITGKFLQWVDNFGTIEDDVKEIISTLSFLSKGYENTDFGKLMNTVITKISGTAYGINKCVDAIKKAPTIKKSDKIDEEMIKNITTIMFNFSQLMKNFDDLSAGLDVLKKQETRDMYIKDSETIFGKAGRAIDWSSRKLTTLFGLMDESKAGENVTGFANMYNNLMVKVENLEGKLIQIIKNLQPIIKSIVDFKKMTDGIKQDVNNFNDDLNNAKKDNPNIEEEIKSTITHS